MYAHRIGTGGHSTIRYMVFKCASTVSVQVQMMASLCIGSTLAYSFNTALMHYTGAQMQHVKHVYTWGSSP